MATKQDTEKQWYMATVSETCAAFEVQPKKGLTTEQVRERTKKNKRTKLRAKPKTPKLPNVFWAVLIVMLVLSASVYALESNSAVLIFVLSALLMATFGLAQQGFVRHVLLVVAKASPAQVTVRRDGAKVQITADAVVPGDIFILSQGDYAPVDLRAVETKDLFVSQNIADGQAPAVAKSTFALQKKTKPLDQKNIILAGSFISSGSGIGIAVAYPEQAPVQQELHSQRLNKRQYQRQVGVTVAVLLLGVSSAFWNVSIFAAVALASLLALSTYYYANFWLQYVTWASLYDQAASNGLKFHDFKRLKSFVRADTVLISVPSEFTDIAAFVHQLQAELKLEVRPLVSTRDVKKLETELNIQDSAITNKEFMNASRAKKLKMLNEYQLLAGFDDVAISEAVSLLQQAGHSVVWIDDAAAPQPVGIIADSYITQSVDRTEFLKSVSDVTYAKQPSLKKIAALFDTKTRFKNITAY